MAGGRSASPAPDFGGGKGKSFCFRTSSDLANSTPGRNITSLAGGLRMPVTPAFPGVCSCPSSACPGCAAFACMLTSGVSGRAAVGLTDRTAPGRVGLCSGGASPWRVVATCGISSGAGAAGRGGPGRIGLCSGAASPWRVVATCGIPSGAGAALFAAATMLSGVSGKGSTPTGSAGNRASVRFVPCGSGVAICNGCNGRACSATSWPAGSGYGFSWLGPRSGAVLSPPPPLKRSWNETLPSSIGVAPACAPGAVVVRIREICSVLCMFFPGFLPPLPEYCRCRLPDLYRQGVKLRQLVSIGRIRHGPHQPNPPPVRTGTIRP